MKYLLAVVGGFAFTSCTFAGGAAMAIVHLSTKPSESSARVDSTSIEFPLQPVKVDVASQNYERIGQSASSASTNTPGEEVETDTDLLTTAALPESDDETILSEEHVAWCSSRYRSYQVADNSYQPYRGGRRECLSPFFKVAKVEDDETYQLAASQEADRPLTSDFIASCMSRYRSYRVEDNTYQPYGDGPRVQCE